RKMSVSISAHCSEVSDSIAPRPPPPNVPAKLPGPQTRGNVMPRKTAAPVNFSRWLCAVPRGCVVLFGPSYNNTLSGFFCRSEHFQDCGNLFPIIRVVILRDFIVIQVAQSLDLLFHKLGRAIPKDSAVLTFRDTKWVVVFQQVEIFLFLNGAPNETPDLGKHF